MVGGALFAVGVAGAAQLTLDWIDNTGSTANFIVERGAGTTGTYAWSATTGTGIITSTDSAVVAGTTYCYRVKTSSASGDSDYSNEACGTVATGFDLTVAKAGAGPGTVVGIPSGINCGGACVATYPAGRGVTLTAREGGAGNRPVRGSLCCSYLTGFAAVSTTNTSLELVAPYPGRVAPPGR